jgi:hypothetical protein
MALKNIWLVFLAGAALAFGFDAPAVAAQAQLLPVGDAGASSPDGVNWVLTDGGIGINTQYLPQFDVDRRGVLEFDISPIPTNAVLTAAALGLDVTEMTQSPGIYPVLRICGYAGDGALSPGDAARIDVLIGQSDPVTECAPITISLDAAFVESLLGQTSYLGLVAWGSANGKQAGFATTEGADFGYQPPLLTLSYSLPGLPLGDANGDGCVDGLDYNTWSGHYLACGQPSWSDGGWTVGNFNEDDCVDGLDYNVWSRNYQAGCGGAGAVPEPGAAALVILGFWVAARGWRGRRSGP